MNHTITLRNYTYVRTIKSPGRHDRGFTRMVKCPTWHLSPTAAGLVHGDVMAHFDTATVTAHDTVAVTPAPLAFASAARLPGYGAGEK